MKTCSHKILSRLALATLFLFLHAGLVGCGSGKSLTASVGPDLEDENDDTTPYITNPISTTTTTVSVRSVLGITNSQGFSFNSVTVGATVAPARFTLTNSGTAPSNNLSFYITGGGFAITSTSCTTVLMANASCTIDVSISASTVGAYSAQLTVNDSYANSLSVALSATLTAQAVGHVSKYVLPTDPGIFPAALVGSELIRVFYLVNDGTAPINDLMVTQPADSNGIPSTIFDVAIPPTLPNDPFTPSCLNGTSLIVGGRCGFLVRFKPSVPAGINESRDSQAAITIGYRDTAIRNIAWSLSGRSTPAVKLVLSNLAPTQFTNIVIHSSAQACITVTNTHREISAKQVQIPFGFANGFSLDDSANCSNTKCSLLPLGTLPAGFACDVGVKFNPTVVGAASSPIKINYDGGFGAIVAEAPVTGSSRPLNVCSLNNQAFHVFTKSAQYWEITSGAKDLVLPDDATEIAITISDIMVDDFGARVSVNGAQVFSKSQEIAYWSYAHTEANVNISLGSHLRAGRNSISGSCSSVFPGDNSIILKLNGSYKTGGACADIN